MQHHRGGISNISNGSFIHRTSKALLAGVALAVLASHGAQAQETDAAAAGQPMPAENLPLVTQLDQVTVVSRTGESPIDQMASVSHVGPEELERRMATTPSQMLFGVPGVTMRTAASRTASDVNIRGLEKFGRVAVIIDGSRQNFQVSGHGLENMFFVDPELIKQVDVIRGPVANTYGSGAIGGVVMIETKDAEDFLRPGETWAGSVKGGYETNGQGWTTSATGAYRFNDMADVIANLVWRDYGEYKDGGDNRVPGTDFNVLSGLVKSTIRPTENSELKFGWNGTNDGWHSSDNEQDIDLKQNTFTGQYHITDADRTWLDLHINASFTRTNLDLTYLVDSDYPGSAGTIEPVPAGTVASYDLDTYGLDIWNTSRFETGAFSHELTYGGDWVSDDVETVSPAGDGSDIYTPPGKRQVWGAYIQDKITYDWLEIIGGLRYDSFKLESPDVENTGDRLSPRITAGISPFRDGPLSGLQFYGTYAEGYRSPSITETLISGIHAAGPRATFLFRSNPDLKPETAKTWEFGINYRRDALFQGNDSLRLKAAYFHNDVDDFIDFQEADPTCPPFGPPCILQNQNFANAEIQGVELEAIYEAVWGFVGLSASFIDGETVTYEGVRDDLATIPSAQVTGQLGLRFLQGKLLVGTEVQYNGAPRGNTVTDDYTLVNAFARYNVNDNFNVDFRVDNLFDVDYVNALSDSAATIHEPGVTLKLAATMRWGG